MGTVFCAGFSRITDLLNDCSFEYVGASLLASVFLLVGQGSLVGRYRKRAGVQYPQSLWTLFLTHHDTLTVGISSVRRESTNGRFEGCTPLQLRSTYVSCYWPSLLQLMMFSYDFRCSPKYTREHPHPLHSVRCRIR